MKKFFFTTAMVFCISILHAQYSFQNLNSELVEKTVVAIAADNDGNTIVTGQFATAISFGSITLINNYPLSRNAGFITKVAPNGSFSWAKKITPTSSGDPGGSYWVTISDITSDAQGNIFITGSFRGSISLDNLVLTSKKSGNAIAPDMFTAKISASGAFQWAKAEGTGLDNYQCSFEGGRSVVPDNQGNVYATGSVVNTVFKNAANCAFCTQDAVDYAIYVVKYNASGTKLWEKKYGNSQFTRNNNCTGIAAGWDIASDGTNIYFTGQMFGTVNFGNNITLATGSNQKSNPFLLKLDGNGNALWAKMPDGTGTDGSSGHSLLVDNQDVYCTGSFTNSLSFGCTTLTGNVNSNNQPITTRYVAKYSASNGNCSWAIVPGYSGSRRVFKHPNGNIAIPASDENAPFTIKEFSPGGVLVNATTATNYNAQGGSGVDYASIAGGFVFITMLKGSYDFGGTTISSTQPVGSNYWDLILVKYTEPAPPVVRPGAITSELSAAGIVLYPNPASHQLTIRNTENKMLGAVMIYDAAGKLVYKNLVGNSQTRINIEKFLPGVYYLRTGQSTSAIKFIKQ
jgi:hypothetical protein